MEKDGRNNRRRMVYSNDIYGKLTEEKQSKYLKQFQTQDKIFNAQNPYLDTENS